MNYYLIYWPLSHVQHTWGVWRPCLQTSSMIGILRLCSTGNAGVKSLVQSWTWKQITSGRIISRSSIPRNEQVSEYVFWDFIYMHLTALLSIWFYSSYVSHVLMIFTILNILCNYSNSYASHISMIHFLLCQNQKLPDRLRWQDSSWYVFLWEGKYPEEIFLHLLNSCCHIVGRSSEVSLSIF